MDEMKELRVLTHKDVMVLTEVSKSVAKKILKDVRELKKRKRVTLKDLNKYFE